MMTTHNDTHAGFTLIELLTALAIGSLLLVLLGTIVGQLRLGWHNSYQTSVRISEQASGIGRLQALVAAGLPSEPRAQDIAFEGNSNGFRFRTLPPQALAQMGVVWASVLLKRDRDGHTQLQLALSNDQDAIEPQLLLTSTTPLRWRYQMRDINGMINTTDQIAASGQLPIAIVLESISDLDGSVQRRIVFVPQNTVDGRCLFDPISFNCRI
jgi:prepilin-type N-terminal cleavage/methylation domain-containing protein